MPGALNVQREESYIADEGREEILTCMGCISRAIAFREISKVGSECTCISKSLDILVHYGMDNNLDATVVIITVAT